MRRIKSLALGACAFAVLAFAGGVNADPGEERHAGEVPPPEPTMEPAPPGIDGMQLLDYEDKDRDVVGTPDAQLVGPASLAVEGTEMSPRVFPRL